MFRQAGTVALVVLTALGSLTAAAAQQSTTQDSKQADAQTTSPAKEVAVDLGGGVNLDLVLISAGSFTMGSTRADKYAIGDERPSHRVQISKPFYLGKYLVTQQQWKAVMGNNPSQFQGLTNPVDNVSWNDCQKFLKTLNGKVGGGSFSLPTEAQWEYACRAGSTTRYCFGDKESQLGDYAWYEDNNGNKTHPVGQKKPNAWGLYDMHGNVWEWCADWFDDEYLRPFAGGRSGGAGHRHVPRAPRRQLDPRRLVLPVGVPLLRQARGRFR